MSVFGNMETKRISTAHLSNFLDRFVVCERCKHPFTADGDHVPKVLNCGHTVCYACASDMFDLGTRQISCLCRDNTFVSGICNP